MRWLYTVKRTVFLIFLIAWIPVGFVYSEISPDSSHDVLEVKGLILNKVLHFGSGLFKQFKVFSAKEKRVNLREKNDQLSILGLRFNSLGQTSEDLQGAAMLDLLDPEDDTVVAEIIGPALAYPNPFRQAAGGGQIGYRLSKNMEIEIHLYDMLSNRIASEVFPKGSQGGRKGYNKIDVNLETWQGYLLSAGIYFFLLIHEGEVISKGKMAVIP